MPTVNFAFQSVDATLTSGVIRVWSPNLRPGGTAAITSEPSWVNLVDGHASMDLEPGPVVGKITGNGRTHDLTFTVPSQDDPVDYLDLLDGDYVYEPEVIQAAQQAAREAQQWALRSEQGADRVGSAEVVLDARDQATAAATTATGAATTATEQADRATTEADRAGSEADRATGQATAASSSATDADASATVAEGHAQTTQADAAATASDREVTVQNREWTASARGQAQYAQGKAEDAATTATTQAERAESEADRASAAADLADGAAVQAVTDRVDTLLSGAPEAYDTLSEIAEKLADQDDVASAMTAQIGQKVDQTSTGNSLYGTDAGGNQTQIQYANSATANTVAYRGTDGTLPVGEPTDSAHATTKSYVDEVKTTAEAALPESMLQVVDAAPADPTAGVFYFVRE